MGTQVDGDPAPSPKGGGRSPQFPAHVYCGQTAAWINMPLSTEVGLGPDDILSDGDPAPLHKKGGGTPSPISAYVYCGQTAGWIKMTLDTEVAFGPGHIVLDGDQAPLPQKGGAAPLPNLANDWIDQDATCYGSKPRSTRHCLSWGPSSP